MAGREAVTRTIQQVRPVLSVNKDEAKRRVFNLYKAWYRKIPFIGKLYTMIVYSFSHLIHSTLIQ